MFCYGGVYVVKFYLFFKIVPSCRPVILRTPFWHHINTPWRQISTPIKRIPNTPSLMDFRRTISRKVVGGVQYSLYRTVPMLRRPGGETPECTYVLYPYSVCCERFNYVPKTHQQLRANSKSHLSDSVKQRKGKIH